MYERAMYESKTKILDEYKNAQIEQEEKISEQEADDFAKQLGFDFDDENLGKEILDDEKWMKQSLEDEELTFPDEMSVEF